MAPGDWHLASAGAGFRLSIGGKSRLEIQAANTVATDIPGLKSGTWRRLFGFTASQ